METPEKGTDVEKNTIGEDSTERNQVKRSLLYLVLVVIVTGSLLSLLALSAVWADWRLANEPLHSTVEALGALAAMVMVMFLVERKGEEYGDWLFLIAMAFLGMGLLDGFHAVSTLGHGFVLLHSVASLVGGFWFVLVWLPRRASDGYAAWKRSIPWVVVTVSMLFGLWTLAARETLPVMLRQGQFTNTAVGINLLAGVFFVLAAGRFLLDFHRSGKLEIYLFTCMAVLFGVAELTFQYSSVWGGSWWLWHLLRLIAYLLVLGYVVHEYQRTVSGLRVEITERKLAQEKLRERTQELEETDEMIRKLSTPLVEVGEGIVMLPLIGLLDSARAKQLTESVLERITETRTKVIVMDISGIAAIDTKTASHILRAIQAVRLMGSDVIITGIRPDVATTLVSLGIDLSGIVPRGTLREGLEYAFAKLGSKVTR